jgi:hypothetical protein
VTADQAISQVIKYLRLAVLAAILLLLAVILLRQFGVSVPLRTIGHVELAYLAGVYWLTK